MPTPRVCVLAIAGLLAAAGSAHADENARLHRFELTLGTMIGSHDIGRITGPAAGLHTELTKYFGDVGIVAGYDLMGVGDAPTPTAKVQATRGIMHRLGLQARWAGWHVGQSFIAADFWLEGGIGREYIQWDGGGKLTRNDYSIGLGAHPVFSLGSSSKRYIGYYLAFKMLVSESPDARFELPATCAGPCDEATPPPTTDLSFFFNFGFTFGK